MDSPMPSVSTPPTSVASNDGAGHDKIRFTSMKALLQTIHGVSGDFLTVTGFPPREVTKLVETEKRFRGIRLRRYDSHDRILFITIPTRVHERQHLELYYRIKSTIERAGLGRNWGDIGATTYSAQGHPGGSSMAEGDSSGGPRPQRGRSGTWPTLVIESGVSEPLSELHKDMRWWFSASQHDVKIVLLTQVNRSQRAILVQRWGEEEEEAAAPRPGATTTTRQAAAALRPVLRQEIKITQNTTTTNPVSYHTTRGDLVLPFHLLFLRAPSPQESDIILSIGDLESWAELVFETI